MTEQRAQEIQPAAAPEPTYKPPEDTLAKLIEEAAADQKRILAAESIEDVREALSSTVMATVRDLAKELVKLRDWAGYAHFQHANHLDEHEERLGYVEAATFESSGEQLSSETWTTFMKVAQSLDVFVEAALATTHTPDGKKKLEEQQAIARDAIKRLEEISIIDDDDDSEADDDQQ